MENAYIDYVYSEEMSTVGTTVQYGGAMGRAIPLKKRMEIKVLLFLVNFSPPMH